ncbi:MAG: Rpn family recombination-promoting nuclease/putative transposase [Spirochaetales bacterium]|nr:Rpn family recombination-promoting nuclease/putative transposase [Spirochaetales bacterium]
MIKFKAWEDLTFTDDFMFSQVMKNKEICKEVVETILGIKVGKIEFLTSQYEIEIDPEAKTIAMDVYLRDEKKIINVELQNGHRLELPKRSRYYQAAADIDNTLPGELYSEMKDNYVIFICTFDPFLHGKAFYKFENIYLNEDKPLRLNDGTYKIFLNTASDDLTLLDPELKLFYDYIRRGTADSTLTEKINSSITELKENRETRRKYMTYTTRIAEAKSEAREEGIKYGIAIGEKAGEERGRNEAKLETAKNALTMNLSIEQVATLTGLSPEEIEKL